MTKKELINHIQEYLDSGMWQYEGCYLGKEDLETIVEVLKAESCGDCISREAVLKKISGNILKYEDGSTVMQIISDIKELPSVQPIRVKGDWQITDAYPHNVYCSECHTKFAQTRWAVWEDGSLPRNYCPNCGADMRGE